MTKISRYRIMVVDDEVDICRALEFMLINEGYSVVAVHSAEKALDLFGKQRFDLVLSDFKMEGMSGIDLLVEIKKISEETPFVLMTAFASVENAVEAMRKGAADYIVKPFLHDDVLMTLGRLLKQKRLEEENITLRRQLSDRMALSDFVGGSSTAVSRMFADMEKVIPTKSNILLLGESGTGKSLIAELIHKGSPRRDFPFLSINCSAIPETLLESELFGYKKGAFTGASSNRKGLVESCDGGTLFLDEIGDMPLTTQAKILKLLETGNVMPLGDSTVVSVDVRFIAATNHALEQMVKDGRFREDLYYRLDVIQFTVPPLRQRREDIEVLAKHFMAHYAKEHDKDVRQMEPSALEALKVYQWAGNVRELKNVMERAVVLCGSDTITVADFPEKLMQGAEILDGADASSGQTLKDMVGSFERKLIIRRLKELDGDKEEVAKSFGIDIATLYRKIKKLDI